jgi:predicted RNA binding protein YcfA (HicA-like mRNA interferase family)
MKYSELHRKVRRNGWKLIRVEGSHYIYEKNGIQYPVPYHGAKEVGRGLASRIIQVMKLRV